MSTHPLVLLVEPDPLLRELLHGELKDQGCIVVDAGNSEEAIAFAQVYPGPIDLAVTDLRQPADDDRAFLNTLRSLPTGSQAKVVRVEGTYDRQSLVSAVRHALPAAADFGARPPHTDRAVFWGTGRESAVSSAVQ